MLAVADPARVPAMSGMLWSKPKAER